MLLSNQKNKKDTVIRNKKCNGETYLCDPLRTETGTVVSSNNDTGKINILQFRSQAVLYYVARTCNYYKLALEGDNIYRYIILIYNTTVRVV